MSTELDLVLVPAHWTSRSIEGDLAVAIPACVRSLAISSEENFNPIVRRRVWILSYDSTCSFLGCLGLGGLGLGDRLDCGGKVLLVCGSLAKPTIREKPLVPSCNARSCGSKSSLGGLLGLSGADFLLSMSRKRSKGGFSIGGDCFFGEGLFGGGLLGGHSSGDGGLKGGPEGPGLCCDG